MKAISLWQPWASAMAMGLKTVETRHWWTSHRGLTAIHAAKRWTRDEREFAAHMGLPEGLPLGALVAVGDLVRCVRTDLFELDCNAQEYRWGNYAAGRQAWVFKNIRALPEPIPFKGAQGFFEVPDELLSAVAPPAAQGALL